MEVALTLAYVKTADAGFSIYSQTHPEKDLPVYTPRKMTKAEAQYVEYAADLKARRLRRPPATRRGGNRRFNS
jgi:hypothetical protein